MKPKKILSMVMTFLMVLSLLPSLVFAAEAPSGELGGKLKVKGTAAVGYALSADYSKVTPQGVTDDYVSFSWSRKTGDQLTEVGTEKTYTLTSEDLGNKIELKITGLETMGVTGTLKVDTVEIAATAEEAPADPTEPDTQNEAGEASAEPESQDTAEETPAESAESDSQDTSENPADSENQETTDEVLTEDIPIEEEAIYDEMQPVTDPSEEDLQYTTQTASDNEGADDSVIDIGIQESLVIPEDGQSAAETGDTDTNTENADAGTEDAVYMAEAVTPDESGKIDFGTLEEGYTDPEPQYVTITNTGTAVLNFNMIAPEHFMAQDIIEPLEPGESVSLWVVPRTDVSAGEYHDTLTYTTQEGVSVSFEADFTVAGAEASVDSTEETEQSPALAEPEEASIAEEPTETPASEEPTETPASEEPAEASDPEPTATPVPEEPTATPDPEEPVPDVVVENSPILIAEDGISELNLGTVAQGEQTSMPIVLRNEGTGTVTLVLSETTYSTAALSEAELPADGSTSVVLTVTNDPSAAPGEYAEELQILDEATGEVLMTIPISFTVNEEDNPELSADLSELDFGSREEGYEKRPKAKTVTLTNTGNVTLTDLTVFTEGEDFNIGEISADTLEPGQTATFSVRPVAGLSAGLYSQEITVASDRASLDVTATFTVTDTVIRLTGIEKPEDITLANGVAKSAAGMNLPSSVTINTSDGSMEAAVAWDVQNCTYVQNSTESQKFSVKGTVTLPEGVTNPDNLDLLTSVNVTVSRAPIVPDASSNTITGISSTGSYTTETKITFNAVGAGMDNGNPIKGDVRYQPLCWEVLESRSWDSAPYSATFRMGKSGGYTLTVTYNQQKFDGSNWVNTGTQDTKQVSFTVSEVPNQTLTSAADKTDANQKNAVKTGDDTPILPFVIILVVAVVLIIGVLIYRKKKN